MITKSKEEVTIKDKQQKDKKTYIKEPNKPSEQKRKKVVTIDNGIGEGEDRMILLNNKVIAYVFITNKIYDYKDYYIAIEKENTDDEMGYKYNGLIVVNKYTGKKEVYKIDKIEKNFAVWIENFDKEKGVLTIDTGITKYSFDMNTRVMIEDI